MAGLFEFLFGSNDKLQKVPTMTSQQQNVLGSLLSQLLGGGSSQGTYQGAQDYLSQLLQGNEESFNRFEAPYMRQFQERTIPGIAERFAGLGAMGGGLSSSGFGQALSSAGADLSERLASLRSQLQGQAANTALNQYNTLAGLGLGAQPFGYQQKRGSPGFLANAIGSGLSNLTTGGMGGLFSSLFGGR